MGCQVRTTLNGFSAACGKLGATIGSAAFVPLKAAIGLGPTMVTCAVVSLLGLLLTFAFIEDRRGQHMEGELPSASLLSVAQTIDGSEEGSCADGSGGVATSVKRVQAPQGA